MNLLIERFNITQMMIVDNFLGESRSTGEYIFYIYCSSDPIK